MVKVGMASLGCPRNLVDSEVILGSLKKYGYEICDIADGVDILIINTCSFVKSAREESVDAILEAAQLKKEGKLQHIIVCGCLTQLYGKKLLETLPEIDSILGTSDFAKIQEAIINLKLGKRCSIVSNELNYLYNEHSPRFLLTPRHYAYVKISEGCDNLCSYCIISRLRGSFRSRTIESVLAEVKHIASAGLVKEINIIGQDTTLYGMDLYGKGVLPELLRKIADLKNSIRWIRVLYTHPAHYSEEFLSIVRREPKVCKYFDIPIQHSSDTILKKMNRHTTKKEIAHLIKNIRKMIPEAILRTSIIVGFPGESDAEFKELISFIKETRFERLGAFIYSKEEGTRAARFKGQVPEKVKKERFNEVMKVQQEVSREVNRYFLGKTMDILIDEKVANEKGLFLGRTYGDAPEVDGTVYVKGKNVVVGDFCKVKITDTLEYDLVGEPA